MSAVVYAPPDRAGATPSTASLWSSLAAEATDERLAAWLALQCAMLPSARQAVVVLGNADAGPFVPRAVWPAESRPGEGLARVAEQALAERVPLLQPVSVAGVPGVAAYVVAFPVEMDGALHGVVAVECPPVTETQLQQVMRDLQWGIAWIETFIRRDIDSEGNRIRERLMIALDIIATTLEEDTFDGACRALVTELALRFNCDRVSMGLSRDMH